MPIHRTCTEASIEITVSLRYQTRAHYGIWLPIIAIAEADCLMSECRLILNRMFTVFVEAHGASTCQVEDWIRRHSSQLYHNFEVIFLGIQHESLSLAAFPAFRGVYFEPDRSLSTVLDGSQAVDYRGEYVIFSAVNDSLQSRTLDFLVSYLTAASPAPPDIVLFDFENAVNSEQRYLPGWDPDLIQYLDYVQGSFCISSEYLRNLCRHNDILDIHGLLRKASAENCYAIHVPECLATLRRHTPVPERLDFRSGEMPSLSIVIPNRNGIALLPRAIAFLKTIRFPYELVIVDNGSDDGEVIKLYEGLLSEGSTKIVSFDRAFNYSAMINLGVRTSSNDYILILNNDVFVSDPEEVALALSYATQPSVGVVGSVLRYSDGSIQHAGMALSVDGSGYLDTEHVLRFARFEEAPHIGALTAPKNWQSVTGAFQLMRRNVFVSAGGYDEVNLPVEFNDVDFCLRVRAKGWRVVCLPLRDIVHDESQTRSSFDRDKAAYIARDAYGVMHERWFASYEASLFVNPRPKKAEGARSSIWKSLRSRIANSMPAWRALSRSPDHRNHRSSEFVSFHARSRMAPSFSPGVCIIGALSGSAEQISLTQKLLLACDLVRIPVSVVDTARRRVEGTTVSKPFPDCQTSIYVEPRYGDELLCFAATAGRILIAYHSHSSLRSASESAANKIFDEIWMTGPDVQRELSDGATTTKILNEPAYERAELLATGLTIKSYLEELGVLRRPPGL